MKDFLTGLSDLNFGTCRTWFRVPGVTGLMSDITDILDLIFFLKEKSISGLKTFTFISPYFTAQSCTVQNESQLVSTEHLKCC